MNTKRLQWMVILLTLFLGGCVQTGDSMNTNYGAYEPSMYQGYSSSFTYYNTESPGMRMPEANLVQQPAWTGAAAATPVSSRDVDTAWVQQQNPTGYTIEIADGEKASTVARQLQSAPKADRRAQIRYQNNGKSWYRGVYGSFASREAAENALRNMPPSLQSKASVRRWSDVQ
ncbi:Sporulation related domain protein [Legionella geestiana]|uniref:Sporulation related domain protein n=1 Tax=Legionella geestiana TaxID=45065 RepID=A0A0W0TW83_9GAMM|nr:SPOR domain-containing protein [Legionella geestiana]KTC99659.1 Sporulation related domain protein [Legionella geestiana]QBS13218.1 SPOR domain-containing protein [Legionella geestiana]QDQ39101.1 SPOR domain-containing protein [Legionella geestiana]STX54259.1 Uncharacterized protein conserved in bacteria [Legionella geestiana]